MIKIGRPNIEDAPPWYPRFMALAPGDDLMEAMFNNRQQVIDLSNSIPPSAENFSYAEGKWTIKQVFIHLADSERYYSYKAFCYARQMNADLDIDPAFDFYANNANAINRTLKDISEEFISVRDSTITLFASITNDALDFKFNALPNHVPCTARSLGWMAVGHCIHHCNILKERYLTSPGN